MAKKILKTKETKKQKPAKTKKGFWSSQIASFLTSFRNVPRKRFFKAALFDLLMLIIVIIIINASLIIINLLYQSAVPKLAEVYDFSSDSDSVEYEQALSELTPVMNRILWLSILVIVVTLLLVVFFISWFYGKAWCIALKKRFSKLYLKKYFVINLLWFILLLALFFLIAIFVRKEYAAVLVLIELILFFYMDPVLRTVFDEKKRLGDNIKTFFRVARRVHWFIIPLIISFIVGIILMAAIGFTAKIQILFIILFLIITTIFIGWLRNYFSQVVSYINN